jgi:hypothetical protein
MAAVLQPVVDFVLSNHGVPGGWITGHRMVDIVVLPLVMAFMFPFLNRVLKRCVFQVGLAIWRSRVTSWPRLVANWG